MVGVNPHKMAVPSHRDATSLKAKQNKKINHVIIRTDYLK